MRQIRKRHRATTQQQTIRPSRQRYYTHSPSYSYHRNNLFVMSLSSLLVTTLLIFTIASFGGTSSSLNYVLAEKINAATINAPSSSLESQASSIAATDFSSSLTSSVSIPTNLPSGPIQDATCDVEQLEHANDSQLYCILHELSQTSFFRMFAVDLDHGCPLSKKKSDGRGGFVKKKEEVTPDPTQDVSSTSTATEEEAELGGTCTGGLPDFVPEDHGGKSACGVNDDSTATFFRDGASIATVGVGAPGSRSASPTIHSSETGEAAEEHVEARAEARAGAEAEEEEEEEEEFECGGTGDDDGDIDIGEDEPLCAVQSEPLLPTLEPLTNFFSSALKSIYEAVGWESESQRKAFGWTRPSNPVIMEETDEVACEEDEDGSITEGTLPSTFWIDMCSQIKAGDGLKIVNLALNPERNTGYNGTHIWNAIYEENCITEIDGNATGPMCYEERVLYKLLSGLHTSTTISIAKNYYPPSKRKGRANWEANPAYFMEKFADNPEYIRNLHFSYVVLLRALRKAAPFLYQYEIRTGDIVDDETATILLRRLLDSHILRSCSDVFTAFDESLMFRDSFVDMRNVTSLQKNFKDVFFNISSVLDCVQCQQCKLHGKMAMLGYGAALKVLFVPEEMLDKSTLLSRNEVVAFINTVAKMSESLKEVRELTHLYWSQNNDGGPAQMGIGETVRKLPVGSTVGAGVSVEADTSGAISGGAEAEHLVDLAMGAISKLNRKGKISDEREAELIPLVLSHDAGLLTVAKYYATDLSKFLLYTNTIGRGGTGTQVAVTNSDEPDAIVVGSGLAGLAATLNILDRGGYVVLIEKEHRMGGNSAKASSGINACCPHNDTYGDSLESFTFDTIKSAGKGAQLPLIETLTGKSKDAVEWLQSRAGVDLSLLAQLGGHSHKRTHRPNNGMAGAEIIYGMQKEVKKYEKTGRLRIMVDTRVTKLIYDGIAVTGVEYESIHGAKGKVTAPNVVLATGGFASDRSSNSYLAQYRPELLQMAATAGDFSTGDGIALATELGAGLVDMDKVQVHPTGWIDPSDPHNPTKVLAAELMRGVGGILINDEGKRFCNELGTRAYVTDKMLSHNSRYETNKVWDASSAVPTFNLVLSSSAAADGRKHVDLYTHKGLLTELVGIQALSEFMKINVDSVRQTLMQYRHDAEMGKDEWGKTTFRGVFAEGLKNEIFYAGRITPVLHYCMGGVTVDTEGNVLRSENGKNIIPGLHAAGEVSGGVHGDNRLAGNSLLECTVYGTIVGKKIPINKRDFLPSSTSQTQPNTSSQGRVELKEISMEELSGHNSPDDCWVAIHGNVYDLTDFAEEHPPGALSIHELGGSDGTDAFHAVHNKGMLDDFIDDKVGVLLVDT